MLSLRLVVTVRLDLRRLNDLAKEHSYERLLRKSINAFQVYQYMQVKKREMLKIADKLNELNIMKTGLKMLQAHLVIRGQERRMRDVAEGYRKTREVRKAFEVLKAHKLIQREIKVRNDRCDGVYQKRLKQRLVRFVRTSNKEFRRLEGHIYSLMHSRKMKELLDSL